MATTCPGGMDQLQFVPIVQSVPEGDSRVTITAFFCGLTGIWSS